jgi:CRISPR-associated protein Csx3
MIDDTGQGSFLVRLPAIMIGGPPRSGKSYLTTQLGAALREGGIAHYVLRANPDGEGTWSHQITPSMRAPLRARARGNWSPELAARFAADVAQRHLPLLVDVGGVPSAETARIAAACTHAVLLGRPEAALDAWHNLTIDCGLELVAELRSVVDQAQTIIISTPTLRGTLNGLGPNQSGEGPCFTVLAERVAALFGAANETLRLHHLQLARAECVLDLDQPIFPLRAHARGQQWHPAELPTLLAAVPHTTSLAVYGRGPSWLYAALAAHAAQHPFELFDARLGWLAPPQVQFGDADASRLRWQLISHAVADHLQIDIVHGHLDHRQADGLPMPAVTGERGLILDGRMPIWLVCALARTYLAPPWLALYQPPLNGAVVVRSQSSALSVGQVLPLPS